MRSTSLLQRGARATKRLEVLANVATNIGWHLDVKAAQKAYDRGATIPRPSPTWTHLDLHAGNVITLGGRLSGIVDWVHAGAGDPAADIGQAMVLLPTSQWDALIQGYGGLDPATFTRARAEAVNYALILASVPQAPFTSIGWHGLASLAVARRTQ
jgi:aminoglycoside phosphotransferase (APT) family kinase protein